MKKIQTIIIKDKSKYVGELKDGKMHGQGTLTCATGEKYVGEFKDDIYHGQGTLTFSNGIKYVGEFKDDLYNGQGTLTWDDGRKYVGEFKDNYYHGQGTETFSDGTKYVGEFKDNEVHGQGTYSYSNGTYSYSNGDKHGGVHKESKGKKIKYLIEDEHDIEVNKKKIAIFDFDCGDLGERKNVDNNEDISTAGRKIHDFFVDHNLINNGKKLHDFGCVLRYTIPNPAQYNFYLKNKKYETDYPSHTGNFLSYDLIRYFKKGKLLSVSSSFLEDTEPHTLSLITEHLVSINKIEFYPTMSNCNLFHDEGDFQDSSSPQYITNFLGHKKWFNQGLHIDEPIFDEGKFKNHLDDLIKARKFVDPKIKFEILGATEKEKKSFEFAGLF